MPASRRWVCRSLAWYLWYCHTHRENTWDNKNFGFSIESSSSTKLVAPQTTNLLLIIPLSRPLIFPCHASKHQLDTCYWGSDFSTYHRISLVTWLTSVFSPRMVEPFDSYYACCCSWSICMTKIDAWITVKGLLRLRIGFTFSLLFQGQWTSIFLCSKIATDLRKFLSMTN